MWESFKQGLQVGAGFFVGYFLMRFLTIMAMLIAGPLILMAVCVPYCAEYDRKMVAPMENAVGVKVVNPDEVMWPKGCLIRSAPRVTSKAIGRVIPGKRYYVMQRRRGWVKVGSFSIKGWVGCRAQFVNKKYMEI
jgi:hypothetical protein